MEFLTADCETFFSQDFNLRKLTLEQYCRSAAFKFHCIGLKHGHNDTIGIYGSVLDRLQSRPLRNFSLLCHKTAFDGLALRHHLGWRPDFYFDTLSMAKLIHPHMRSHSLESLAAHYELAPKTVPYDLIKGQRDLSPEIMQQLVAACCHDTDLCYAIFQKLVVGFPQEELRVIDLTLRMFVEPILRLNRDRLHAYLLMTQARKQAILDQLGVTKDKLHSAEKFADLLRQQGIEPPMKISTAKSKKAGRTVLTYAFAKSDDAMKELAADDNFTVQTLAAARLETKSTIDESRCLRLLDMDTRGPLPVFLTYCGAHTTRWSGGDKANWQNFRRGGEIRKSILAPEGYVIVVGDLAQIECRVLNWLAGQWDIVQAFAEGRDIYSENATRFYGRPITKLDKLERHLGKTLELGCGYGMGPPKFRLTCRGGALGGPPIILTEAEAVRGVYQYRSSHRHVVAYWAKAQEVIGDLYRGDRKYQWGPFVVDKSKIILPNGAALDYSNIQYDGKDYFTVGRRGKRKLYGGLFVENVDQALSRVVISQGMLRIANRFRIVMSTHDEAAWLARKEEADEALAFGLNELKRQPIWADGRLPLDAEGGYAEEYSK